MQKVKRLNERAWVRQVMERYEKLEELQPLNVWATTDIPDWAYRACVPLANVSHPGLTRTPLGKWRSKELGQFLGRQSGLDAVMWDEVPLGEAVAQDAAQFIAAHEKAFGLKLNRGWAKAERNITSGMRKWREKFKRFIDEVIVEARHRSYLESSTFLEAFAKANKITDADFDNRKIGVGERIAWVMYWFWKPISQFENVGQLHDFLSKVAKPMGITITLKRVEKLCRRIGLKFRERGRPKKKNPTNPPPCS